MAQDLSHLLPIEQMSRILSCDGSTTYDTVDDAYFFTVDDAILSECAEELGIEIENADHAAVVGECPVSSCVIDYFFHVQGAKGIVLTVLKCSKLDGVERITSKLSIKIHSKNDAGIHLLKWRIN